MKIRTSLFRPLAVCVAAILIAGSAFGQTTPEKPGESFDFVLQLIEGGQGASVNDGLPAGWEKVEKQLRSTFSVKGFATIGTFVVRGTTNGTAGYEGNWRANENGNKAASVVRFSLANLGLVDGKIVARTGNFYLGIPAVIDLQQPANARDEQIFKITLYGVAVEPNTPTVLGSLQVGGIDDPVFVVLTAKTL